MENLKILAIEKGLGFNKKSWLTKNVKKENLLLSQVPEPTESEDFEQGMSILKGDIENFQPDILIGSSRGGKYAVEILVKGVFKGPTLLISAMALSGIPKYVPVLFVHGTKDTTIPIQSIYQKSSSGTKEIVKIVELEDNHSLACLEVDDLFQKLILECYELKNIKFEIKNDSKKETKGNPMNDLLKDLRKKKE